MPRAVSNVGTVTRGEAAAPRCSSGYQGIGVLVRVFGTGVRKLLQEGTGVLPKRPHTCRSGLNRTLLRRGSGGTTKPTL